MLAELKKEVCAANRELDRLKLAPFTWGNVSGIDRKQNLVVIKPSGKGYAELKPADMVVVNFKGQVVEGALRPSTDTPTHLELYKAFPAIGGITHTHSAYATMFAQACRPIPALGTTHADQFRGEVPLTRPLTRREVQRDYEKNTGLVIAERFAALSPVDLPGVLVANHGAFAWGRDARTALLNGAMLEEIARMAYGTLTLNPQITPVPAYLLEKHYQRKHGAKAYYGQTNG
jgi:L-ribulose-5-phosphate 4-epimerase